MTSPTTNRRYGVSSGTAIKAPCRVGTTVNITLSGLQTIDGITVVADDRVLVKNQSNTTENGIYVAASGDWSRDVDADGNYDIQNGTTVLVTSGGQAKTFWMFSGTNPIVPGSSAVSIVVAPQTQPTDLSTFLATATGGSSSRTLAAHYGDIVNVLDYGAVGDGVTDDTTSVNAAFTAALARVSGSSKQVAVWFPPDKTYLLNGVQIGSASAHYVTVLGYGARLLLKAQTGTSASPLFYCQSAGVSFYGFWMEGNATNNNAVSWSDSFAGGAQGQGRSFRCGIRASASAGVGYLNVADCTFYDFQGAGIATQSVNLNIRDNFTISTAYEGIYSDFNATQYWAKISNNRIQTCLTGDATVNAAGISVNGSSDCQIVNNEIYQTERSAINFVCNYANTQLLISNNIINTNTKDNYAGISVDSTNAAIYNMCISNNTMYNVGAGIKCTGTNLLLGTILSNQVYTTTGTTSADGISIAQVATANIANNSLHDIKRHGIIVSGQTLNFICTGNTVYGKATATSYGLQLNATTGSWPNAVIRNNIFSNFEGAAGGLGTVNFTRSAAYVFTICTFQNNIILTGGAANKGLSDGGVALLTNGSITDCSVDGFINMTSTNVRYVGNLITGTLVMPAATANFDLTSTIYTTLGAAAANYPVVRLNNTNYLVSLFTT